MSVLTSARKFAEEKETFARNADSRIEIIIRYGEDIK
jgi:hypothetical protein